MTKFLTAQERFDKTNDNIIKKIEQRIEEASNKGEYYLLIHCKNYDIYQKIKQFFRPYGYHVYQEIFNNQVVIRLTWEHSDACEIEGVRCEECGHYFARHQWLNSADDALKNVYCPCCGTSYDVQQLLFSSLKKDE